MISSAQLRQKWLDFWTARHHVNIGSASLIPENDPTVLFTTAGMHPLVPYLLGARHPEGQRLANVQKCVRTGDIDEVGDSSHCTFFQMLGNWSLGDYFQREMIPWSWEFLTSPDFLGIDPSRLAVSVFAGDEDCPRDELSAQLWTQCGLPPERIFFLPKKNNWWGPAGATGPCGPDTEMFVITGDQPCGPDCSPACDCGRYLEIWNDVFMCYDLTAEGKYQPLAQRNVDTGMGLERTLAVLTGVASVYETDLFAPIIAAIEQAGSVRYGADAQQTRAMRIIADHIRTAVFLIGDQRGIVCGNVGQGYVLRRLLRRAIRYALQLELAPSTLTQLGMLVVDMYGSDYPELVAARQAIADELDAEQARFGQTVNNGLKEFHKLVGYLVGNVISGKAAFRLYETFGFPLEMTVELAAERGLSVNVQDFATCAEQHRRRSQQDNAANAPGGLADNTQVTARLHTATHLLHHALKVVLDDDSVNQRGSNITAERLRFDFSFGRALTPEEIERVQSMVNEAIAADVPVECSEMTVDQARQKGAIGLFESRYGERVTVFSMGDYSMEICGGPHAGRTGELGRFEIVKEQSSSAGVRRIKAVLK